MKNKIISHGFGLLSSPMGGVSTSAKMSNSSACSTSGYSLAAGGTNCVHTSQLSDNNPLIFDKDFEEDTESMEEYEDQSELTEWGRLEDDTPCASRSTSFYRGFFDSTHEKLSSIMGGAPPLFKRGSGVAPFQTGLCITLALGFICGIVGLFMGSLLTSWSESTCENSVKNTEDFWQQKVTRLIGSSTQTESPELEDLWKRLQSVGDDELDGQKLSVVMGELESKLSVGWHSIAMETLPSVATFTPTTITLSLPDDPHAKIQRLVHVPPTTNNPKSFFHGTLVDMGDCENLVEVAIRDFNQSTILLCGYSLDLPTAPIYISPDVEYLLVFNRSSSPTDSNKSPIKFAPHLTLQNLPVPYAVLSDAVPDVFYGREIRISIGTNVAIKNISFVKALIKGSAFEDELIIIGTSIRNKDSLTMLFRLIRLLDNLHQKGWKSLRSVMLLAWSGELIDIDKWTKVHSDLLSIQLKSFIDLTNPIQGRDTFSSFGSVALKQAAFIASKQVLSQHADAYTLYDRWRNCIPELLPFNYSVPKIIYPIEASAAELFQKSASTSVLSFQYQNAFETSPNKFCTNDDQDASLTDYQLLTSLVEVTVRFLLMMTDDPVMPFNIVDVTHAISQALPADYDEEVGTLVDRLQIESTHIHAFLDFSVPVDSISAEESKILNQRLFTASFRSLEKILIRFGESLNRVKELTRSLKKRNFSTERSQKVMGSVLTDIRSTIKNHLEDALTLLSAQTI